MNATPHTHDIKIRRPDHLYKILYGDTETWARPYRWRLQKRLDRSVRRAIRRHDKGSLKAGMRDTTVQTLQQAYNDKLVLDFKVRHDSYYGAVTSCTTKAEWGGELLKDDQRRDPSESVRAS